MFAVAVFESGTPIANKPARNALPVHIASAALAFREMVPMLSFLGLPAHSPTLTVSEKVMCAGSHSCKRKSSAETVIVRPKILAGQAVV
jgi:hypothetical protein